MQEQAILQVVSKNLYNQDPQRTPIPYGVLDPRMVRVFKLFMKGTIKHELLTNYRAIFLKSLNVFSIHVYKLSEVQNPCIVCLLKVS